MTLKVYFAASISGGRKHMKFYPPIVKELKKHAIVLTEQFADQELNELDGTNKDDKFIYEQDMGWILSADLLVAEVSNPSLGVGYELRTAQEKKIPVLCLYKPQINKRLSAMISGTDYFTIKEYETIKELTKHVKNFMESYIKK